MIFCFRKMSPLGSIHRGFVAPIGAMVPPLLVALIVVCDLFGLHLNFGINLVYGAVFYSLASAWFLKPRAKFVDQRYFLEASLKLRGHPKHI